MNIDDVRRILSFVSACCPAQRIDATTADAWAVLLRDQDYDSVYLATQRVAKRERFVNVSDVLAETRAARQRIPKQGEWGACPEHHGQWLTSCGPCRSERIGATSD